MAGFILILGVLDLSLSFVFCGVICFYFVVGFSFDVLVGS